jgi:hypothetical protein
MSSTFKTGEGIYMIYPIDNLFLSFFVATNSNGLQQSNHLDRKGYLQKVGKDYEFNVILQTT